MTYIMLSKVVEQFVNERVGQMFTLPQLRTYCESVIGVNKIAPDSPDRTMRKLRKRGVINYELINHNESKYLALPLVQKEKQ